MKKGRHENVAPSLNKFSPENDLSYDDLIADIGCLFINKPYKAGTLEGSGKEKLIVNISGFDCTTFVETVLALAKCAAAGKCSRSEFQNKLKLIRYRQGRIEGYFSRLHYFTDWVRDNERKKIVTDVSRKLGGKPLRKKIDFMTDHCELYPALKNKTQFAKMKEVEKSLSRKVFHIIGKDKINKQKTKIENGDVIAFATNQKGLDVAHLGFAIWQGRNLHLLHASSKENSVVISKRSLEAYLKSSKKFTGIIVVRPI